jgi:alpha-D-xyloside xylohydrolase
MTKKYSPSWKLEAVIPTEVHNMVGGEAAMDAAGSEFYTAEFTRKGKESARLLLLDFGLNNANQTAFLLNNHRLGELISRKTPARFCVPGTWLKNGVNRLGAHRTGRWRAAWVDNSPEVSKKDAPPRNIKPGKDLSITPFAGAGKVVRHAAGQRGVIITTSSGLRIGVAFPHQDMVRLTAAPGNPEAPLMADEIFFAQTPPYAAPQITEDRASLNIRANGLTVAIKKADASISILRADGSTVRKNIEFLTAGKTVAMRWPADKTEHFFGLGEDTTSGMDKRGKREPIYVIHHYDKCDKPVPFMLSTAGFGLYLHSSYRAMFDLAAGDPKNGCCFVDHTRMDMVVLTRPRFPELVRDFTTLTGRSPLPPRWAFGFWQSTRKIMPQSEMEENIHGFREKQIPVDVLAIDPNWQEPKFQNLKWDRGNFFPRPEELLALMKKERLHLALWSAPFINASSELYAIARDRGYGMRDRNGKPAHIDWWMGFDALLLDFTNPETCRWWGKLLAPFIETGVVSIIKIDGGDTNETPPELYSHDGHSMRELHNMYPVLFAKGVHEAIRETAGDRRVLTWIRTGFTGIQRFPCCWGGDQPANYRGGRTLIKGGQQSGLMGIAFWSHDLGGFGGQPTEEYYIRSFQWGLFNPLSRAHGGITAPWRLTPRAEAIITRFIRLRYRLMPTIYSYARASQLTGEPMMRAMVLDHQDDPQTYKADYQYMFGPDLLVAPSYEESKAAELTLQRDCYLPEGTWYDYWTDQRHAGRKTLKCKTAIESLPVFVRGGGLLLYGPDTQRAADLPENLSLHAYAGGNGHLDYYEDDGTSHAYLRGEHATRAIDLTDNGRTMTLTIGATAGKFAGQRTEHPWQIVIHGLKTMKKIALNGQPVHHGEWNAVAKTLTLNLKLKREESITLQLG